MGQPSLAPISLLFFRKKHMACLQTVGPVLKSNPHQLRGYYEVDHLAASATLTCVLSCTDLDAAEPYTNWLHCLVQLYVLLCSATSTKNMATSCRPCFFDAISCVRLSLWVSVCYAHVLSIMLCTCKLP